MHWSMLDCKEKDSATRVFGLSNLITHKAVEWISTMHTDAFCSLEIPLMRVCLTSIRFKQSHTLFLLLKTHTFAFQTAGLLLWNKR